MLATTGKIKLQNKTSVIEVDLHGGAITDFHLKENPINPLSFQFSKDQMPENNKSGAVYQGHFLCAGRWGEPSPGEIKAGIPNHGQPANSEWQIKSIDERNLVMETAAHLEGLHIIRTMKLEEETALCHVTETICNVNCLGRLYQFVQHPTVAEPFLNETTVVNCNATVGFDYLHADKPTLHFVNWPIANDEIDNPYDLRYTKHKHSSVCSFVVNPDNSFGWLTAHSSMHNLLLGYVWERIDYPWINLWQHFENGLIRYRGLEFGTTGLHQPFKKIIENNNLEILKERTVAYIDAGEEITRDYSFFLFHTNDNFKGVEKVEVQNGAAIITECS